MNQLDEYSKRMAEKRSSTLSSDQPVYELNCSIVDWHSITNSLFNSLGDEETFETSEDDVYKNNQNNQMSQSCEFAKSSEIVSKDLSMVRDFSVYNLDFFFSSDYLKKVS